MRKLLCLVYLSATGFTCQAQIFDGNIAGVYIYESPDDFYYSELFIFEDSTFAIVTAGCFSHEESMGRYMLQDSNLILTSDTTILLDASGDNISTQVKNKAKYFTLIKNWIGKNQDSLSANLFKSENFRIREEGLIRFHREEYTMFYARKPEH